MSNDRIGSAGTQQDIELRVGATLGPIDFTDCRDDAGALIDFTGSSFQCVVSLRDGNGTATLTPTVEPVALGHYRLQPISTAALATSDLDFFKPKPKHNWILWRTDSAGVRRCDFFGVVHVSRESLE